MTPRVAVRANFHDRLVSSGSISWPKKKYTETEYINGGWGRRQRQEGVKRTDWFFLFRS